MRLGDFYQLSIGGLYMAIATALQPVEMPSLEVWFGAIITATNSTIIISDGIRTQAYTGSFSYDLFGQVTGTLEGTTYTVGGVQQYSVTDIGVSAFSVYQAIQIRQDAQLAAQIVMSGDDRMFGSSGEDVIRSFDGDDFVDAGGGSDRVEGGLGNDTLRGKAGADVLVGDAGNDRIVGGSGRDQLFGSSGNDRLSGGVQGDRLVGGSGRDRLEGGAGRDTFVFLEFTANGVDRILDFQVRRDRLVGDFDDATVRTRNGDTIVNYDDGRLILVDVVATADDLGF